MKITIKTPAKLQVQFAFFDKIEGAQIDIHYEEEDKYDSYWRNKHVLGIINYDEGEMCPAGEIKFECETDKEKELFSPPFFISTQRSNQHESYFFISRDLIKKADSCQIATNYKNLVIEEQKDLK